MAQPLTTGLRCRATSVAKNLNSTYWLDTSLAKDTRCFGWAPVLGQAKPRQAPAKSSNDDIDDKNYILYLFVWPTIAPAMLGGSPSMTLPKRRKVNYSTNTYTQYQTSDGYIQV